MTDGSATSVVRLSRGGTYVPSPHGPVQVGVPPETIKDALAAGLEVPSIFVVPPELFDRRRGLTLAEVEFPSYFNYFVRKRRTTLVVDDLDVENRLRTVFRESLFGPPNPNNDAEFARDFPRDRRPQFSREIDHFRRGPDAKRTDVDDLVRFVRLDAGPAELGDGLRVERRPDEYAIFDGDTLLGVAPARVDLPARPMRSIPPAIPFEPPAFGVTVLGASHGFDPSGKTTGFVLWVGGRGILVDPPCDTTEHLRERGVMPKVIEGVILTHCHADHDAGVLAKLLEEGRVRLYTTPTILGSFLRKYSAISGIASDLLRRTFSFSPVTIGQPTSIGGAELVFFYTLHSIPAVGFEAYYGGKSLALSGDSLYDPARIRALCESGVITPARRDALIDFPWHHNVVLHEAGVPPLHTPIAALAALPPQVKERLLLVHIAKKDVPPETGLRTADVGLDHTIRIDVEAPELASAADLLGVFCAVDFFRELPMSRAREVLTLARRRRVPAGTKIIAQDSAGAEFFVIASGSVSVIRDGEVIKSYHAGDYFGETALVLDQPRTADVVARSDVDLAVLDRHGFAYLLRGTDIPRRLVRLARARDERAWEVVEANAALRQLTGAQRTQLLSYLETARVEAGEVLWSQGDAAQHVVLLDDARVVLEGQNGRLEPFGHAALLAEVDALGGERPHETTARVIDGGRIHRASAAEFAKFLADNPGVLLQLVGTRFAE